MGKWKVEKDINKDVGSNLRREWRLNYFNSAQLNKVLIPITWEFRPLKLPETIRRKGPIMKKLKDGLESSFDPHVVANQMTNAREMARQCRKVNYDEVQRSPAITPIEAPYSSVSRNSATLFYSHSKHYQPLLLTFLTLHDPNYKTYKPRKYSYCNTY